MKSVHAIVYSRAILAFFLVACLFGHLKCVPAADASTGILRENSKVFTEDRILELEEKFAEDFPSYLIGYDYEGVPVFLFQFGKYNFVALGENEEHDFIDFLDWLVNTAIRQAADKSEQGVAFLMDMDGFSLNNVGSTRAMRVALNLFQFTGKISSVLKYGVIFNANFATHIYFNLARPFLGDFAGRIEIHGNHRERWMPVLLRKLPADQLPPQYGGDASKFKMVAYYG